jgi:hypothetical protein
MLTKRKLFFWSPDANFFYGHKKTNFQDFNRPFQKWTFINVQIRFPENSLGKNNCSFYIYYRFSYLKTTFGKVVQNIVAWLCAEPRFSELIRFSPTHRYQSPA